MSNKITVGSLDFCSLPDLNIENLQMRVDTGAKTSSLHVDNIQPFKADDGKRWITFEIHPDIHDVDKVTICKAKVKSRKSIKTSNEVKERRYVIETNIVIRDQSWPIELNLTDRSNMQYLMLLGREAMSGKILVDPDIENTEI